MTDSWPLLRLDWNYPPWTIATRASVMIGREVYGRLARLMALQLGPRLAIRRQLGRGGADVGDEPGVRRYVALDRFGRIDLFHKDADVSGPRVQLRGYLGCDLRDHRRTGRAATPVYIEPEFTWPAGA